MVLEQFCLLIEIRRLCLAAFVEKQATPINTVIKGNLRIVKGLSIIREHVLPLNEGQTQAILATNISLDDYMMGK